MIKRTLERTIEASSPEARRNPQRVRRLASIGNKLWVEGAPYVVPLIVRHCARFWLPPSSGGLMLSPLQVRAVAGERERRGRDL